MDNAETDLTSITWTSISEKFEHGDNDPETCPHQWWEDTMIVYTSYPPCYRQVCKLCGKSRFRHTELVPQERWVKVEDAAGEL